MPPSISPFPVAVTLPCSYGGLRHIIRQFKRQGVGFCIVGKRRADMRYKEKIYTYKTHVLWRAEVPTDENKPTFAFLLERGKKKGPKPGMTKWDGKIVEIWKP